MKRCRLTILYGGLILLIFSTPNYSHAETLEGEILTNGEPVPGMEVRLYHPNIEKEINPVFTDRYGRYYFRNVPRVDGKYDVEYLWGGETVYRKRVTIQNRKNLQSNL